MRLTCASSSLLWATLCCSDVAIAQSEPPRVVLPNYFVESYQPEVAVSGSVVAGVMTAWALGVLIRPVPTALALAVATGRDGRVDTALAWRRGMVWWSAWQDGEAVGEAQLVEAGALAGLGAESVAAPADVVEALAGLDLGLALEPVAWDAADVLRSSASIPPTSPNGVAPLYPRKPDAKTIAERTGS